MDTINLVARGLPFETLFFISIILILFAVFNARFTSKTVSLAPAILTTVGIFATFFGIAIGLLKFDIANVQGSMPALIGGIKTAFWASVFGVGCAVLIKIRAYFADARPEQGTSVHSATIDDLARLLGSLQAALVGKDDSTVISQLKLSRQDTNDRLDALKRSQLEFMDKLAENNSKALIAALEAVIRDFNAKISEQFGDNFKHLNDAVGQLLVWQDNYRKQIEEMIAQQKASAAHMAVATDRYGRLLSNAEHFGGVAQKLESILVGLDRNRKMLEESLGKLGTLLTSASTALPEVEKKVVDLATQMSSGVQAASGEMLRATREVTGAVQSASADLKRLLTDVIVESNQKFNDHIKHITDKTKEQITALDTALTEELTKSLETLGKQLTALSGKFVEDYSPLTEKLRQVVQLGRVN
jgi:DNA anti-recombination protein RmuC